MTTQSRVTTTILTRWKGEGHRITMLTAYDYPIARILDRAGVDVLLVGDSLGMVVLGYPDTLPVTMEDMIHHTRAVVRGARRALVVADMPFGSFQPGPAVAVKNAVRLMKEGGAQAVKLEGGREVLRQVRQMVKLGIPVMVHLGLTPQHLHRFGGYKLQARTGEAARNLLEEARRLEQAGIFSLVLECVPRPVARMVTEAIRIPTIGIGAGEFCDGQVLVVNDMLGLFPEFVPRHVKLYANLAEVIGEAATAYCREVCDGSFPAREQGFEPDKELAAQLEGISREAPGRKPGRIKQ